MRRDSRTIAQLHQYALLWALRISWLCPEHDLKLFTCFCVSPCRKNSSAKNSGASRVCHSSFAPPERKYLVWIGRSILYSLFTFQQVIFKRRVR